MPGEIQLYDSDVAVIGELWAELKHKAMNAGRVNYDDFDREIKERFHDRGFVVDVKWYRTNVEGVLIPEIEVLERVEPEAEFDHEKMAHEVQANVLDIPGEHDLPKIKNDTPGKLWTPGG